MREGGEEGREILRLVCSFIYYGVVFFGLEIFLFCGRFFLSF